MRVNRWTQLRIATAVVLVIVVFVLFRRHWRDVLDVLGVLATVTAAALAVAALVAIKRERRIDFYLDQLASLSEALIETGANPPDRVHIRSALLPAGMVPTAHQWAGAKTDWTDSEAYARYLTSKSEGESWNTWVRAQVLEEIRSATVKLLDRR